MIVSEMDLDTLGCDFVCTSQGCHQGAFRLRTWRAVGRRLDSCCMQSTMTSHSVLGHCTGIG